MSNLSGGRLMDLMKNRDIGNFVYVHQCIQICTNLVFNQNEIQIKYILWLFVGLFPAVKCLLRGMTFLDTITWTYNSG